MTEDAKPCRVAVIGAGAMAREHIRAFADVPGTSVVGISGRTRSKAEALAQEFSIGVVADGVADLYERTKADIVQVSVYETAIPEIMDQVLRHPWTVLMEKPVALDVAGAEAIAGKAEAAGRQVFVGLNRRTLSSTVAVLDEVEADPSPRYIRVQDQQSLETARAIGHHADVVRGWMYANSIHLVDYLLTFGRGEVASVERLVPWDADDPTVVLALVRFSSGDVGYYEAIWNGPGPWACTVSTPRRRWELRPLERASYQDQGSRAVHAVEPDEWEAAFKPGFRRQAERVVAAWRGEPARVPSLREGVRAMRLVADIYGH